jgi:hypothetical protein
LQSYADRKAVALAQANLTPAHPERVVKALTSALVLVAPAGFTEGDRRAWLTSAMMTLEGIPDDLLDAGVAAARMVADHPSKIIPAIMEEIRDRWDKRADNLHLPSDAPRLSPPPKQDFVPCTPEQAEAIIKEFGLRRNPLS